MNDADHRPGLKNGSDSCSIGHIYRELFEQALEAMFVADPQGRLICVNERLSQLTSYAGTELRGMPLAELIQPEEGAREPIPVKELAPGKAITQERWLRRKDGTLTAVVNQVHMLSGGQALVMVKDLTQTKQAEVTAARSARELAALKALGLAINTCPSLTQIASVALKSLLAATRADLAFFLLREGEQLVLQEVLPPQERARIAPKDQHRVGECLCGLAVQDGKPVYSLDIHSDPRCLRQECKRAGIRSFAALPLSDGETYIGVIGLAALQPRDFEIQADFFHTLTHQFAVASRNARLYEAAQQQLAARQRAEANQARLTAILESTSDFVGIATPEGKLTYLNQAGRQMAGWGTAEPLDGRVIGDFHPAWATRIIETQGLSAAMASGAWEGQTAILHHDGREIPVSQVILAHRSAEGALLYFSTIMRDIGERIEAEQRLRENSAWLDRSQQMAHLGSWELDVVNNRLSWSDETYRIFGLEPQQFAATYEAFLDAVHPEDRTVVDATYARSLREGRDAYEMEHRIVRKSSGEIRYVHEKCAHERDAAGHVVRSVGMVQDITERRMAEESLRKNENLLRSVFRAAPIGIGVTHNRILTAVNDRICEMLGCDRQALIGQNARILYPSDADYEYVGTEKYRQIREGGTGTVETRWQCADGRVIDVLMSSTPINPLDLDAGVTFTALDITERKRSERELQRQTALFQNLFRNSPEAIAVLDREDRVLEINRSFETLFGYCQDEARGRDINDLLAPEPYRGEAQRVSQAVAREGQIVEKEAIRCAKDGRPVDVSLIGYPLVVDQQKIGAYAIYRDITERKRALEQLHRSHQTLLTILDGIDATVYVADMDSYEILFMNKCIIDAFGGDFTGRLCHRVFRGLSSPCEHCTNDRLLDAQGQPTGVCTWEALNPIANKWYLNHDRAIRWLDGRMVKLQIATDITERKQMEEEQQRIAEQLRQAQKMESVGRLAGGVAHDFNNMLSGILGHAQLAMMHCSPTESIYADLKAIEDAALRSADLVRQLLAFARKQTVAPKVLDLNSTVAGMLKMLQRLIGEDIDVAWQPGTDLWPVKIDPSQIDQLLANLCVNARDAIAGVGRVCIETANTIFDEAYCAIHKGFRCGPYVMLAVSDNGSGMSKEALKHIFEPFFTTKEIGKGTGLGLATVYGIVKQNEGFINVYSEPGQGSTFKIYLPRFAGQAKEPAAAGTTETMRGQGETVLLVEDEEIILGVAQGLLEALGYSVLAAGTPSQALRLAQAHADTIQLLVTDVVMPEMNGRDLAKEVCAIVPGIKCLFTSGYTANVIAHSGVLDEGVHFLQKPFSMKELASKVREALKQP